MRPYKRESESNPFLDKLRQSILLRGIALRVICKRWSSSDFLGDKIGNSLVIGWWMETERSPLS